MFLRDGSVSPKMTHWRALCGEGPWVKGGADANPGASEESVWWTW